jgi:hypothetical protein
MSRCSLFSIEQSKAAIIAIDCLAGGISIPGGVAIRKVRERIQMTSTRAANNIDDDLQY